MLVRIGGVDGISKFHLEISDWCEQELPNWAIKYKQGRWAEGASKKLLRTKQGKPAGAKTTMSSSKEGGRTCCISGGANPLCGVVRISGGRTCCAVTVSGGTKLLCDEE